MVIVFKDLFSDRRTLCTEAGGIEHFAEHAGSPPRFLRYTMWPWKDMAVNDFICVSTEDVPRAASSASTSGKNTGRLFARQQQADSTIFYRVK